MKINKLKPEEIVYSVEKRTMGNTSMTTTSVFRVRIVEVDPEGKWVMASWNGNPARKFYERMTSKWRKVKPVMIESLNGRSRLATKAELADMKLKAAVAKLDEAQAELAAAHDNPLCICGKRFYDHDDRAQIWDGETQLCSGFMPTEEGD